MFAVGAICSPRVGRVIDRTGARAIMAAGSVVYAAVAGGAGLRQGVDQLPRLLGGPRHRLDPGAQHARPASRWPRSRDRARRRAIALLAIIGGFASTMFWPLARRARRRRWAGAARCWSMPPSISLACAPIHLAGAAAPSRRPHHPPRRRRRRAGGVAPGGPPRVFLLLSLSFSIGAFVFTGAHGAHDRDPARARATRRPRRCCSASLIGPAQVTIRLFELLFGHRYSIMSSAVVGSAMLPLGLGLAPVGRRQSSPWRWSVIAAYGTSNGLKAVQRATLPLALFGRGQFGAYMGRLAPAAGHRRGGSAPPIMAAVLSPLRHHRRALAHLRRRHRVSLAAMVLLGRIGRAVR